MSDTGRISIGRSLPQYLRMAAGAEARNASLNSASPISPSGPLASGMASWWSKPGSSIWNEADMEKIGLPCWTATTRRVVKLAPSRMRSTS
ncbi:hypothetical protein D3C87_1792640 [compost metagenome]